MSNAIVRAIAGSFVLLGAAWAAGASAQTEASWEVVKTPDQCVLSRKVEAPEPGLLMFSSRAGADSYSLVIAVKKLPKRTPDGAQVKIGLDGTGKIFNGFGISGRIDGSAPEAIRINGIDGANFEAMAKASALRLNYDGKTLGPFPLPDAADAVGALKECLAEHLVAMGADPAQFKPGGAPPEPVKSRDDFLPASIWGSLTNAGLRLGIESFYTLSIDENGMIAGCKMIGTPQPETIEKLVCSALLGKMLFRPAHDPVGKALRGMGTFSMAAIVRRDYTSNMPR